MRPVRYGMTFTLGLLAGVAGVALASSGAVAQTGTSAGQGQPSGQMLQPGMTQAQQVQPPTGQPGQMPPASYMLIVPQQQVQPGFHDPQSRMTVNREGYPQATAGRMIVVPVPMELMGQVQPRVLGMQNGEAQAPQPTVIVPLPQQQLGAGFHDPQSRMTVNRESYPQATAGELAVVPVQPGQQRPRGYLGQGRMSQMGQQQMGMGPGRMMGPSQMGQQQARQQRQEPATFDQFYSNWRAQQIEEMDRTYREWRQSFLNMLDQAYRQQQAQLQQGMPQGRGGAAGGPAPQTGQVMQAPAGATGAAGQGAR